MPVPNAILASLYEVLNSELKDRRLTYRDVAKALSTTENRVRLRFANQRLSMAQIVAICELIGMSLTDLMYKADEPTDHQLTSEQEAALIEDMRLTLVLIRIIDDWPIEKIVTTYDISTAQCIQYLQTLDRLRFIDLLPNNVIQKRFKRGVNWVPNGSLHRFFTTWLPDYLDSPFEGALDSRFVARVNLSSNAATALQSDIQQIRQRAEALHEECKWLPESELHNIVLFMAEREWEFPDFKALRRDQAKSAKKKIPEKT